MTCATDGYTLHMAVVTRKFSCPPTNVIEVLADGWLYPTWVVGASRMRHVDETWPHVGSSLHHSFGIWPAVINDSTTVTAWNPPTQMSLEAHGKPFGSAAIDIDILPKGPGCLVTLTEDVVSGPSALVPKIARTPATVVRNAEALRRLAYVAEGSTR